MIDWHDAFYCAEPLLMTPLYTTTHLLIKLYLFWNLHSFFNMKGFKNEKIISGKRHHPIGNRHIQDPWLHQIRVRKLVYDHWRKKFGSCWYRCQQGKAPGIIRYCPHQGCKRTHLCYQVNKVNVALSKLRHCLLMAFRGQNEA